MDAAAAHAAATSADTTRCKSRPSGCQQCNFDDTACTKCNRGFRLVEPNGICVPQVCAGLAGISVNSVNTAPGAQHPVLVTMQW